MLRRGVRYYQAVPPPREEWEPDYAAIARAGLHFVVVPMPWNWGHADEESFDVSPVLGQLDLAEQHGLEVLVAVDLTTAPLWLAARHPEFLHENAAGTKARPRATPEAPGGGWPGLCFDNGAVRAHAGRFLRAVAGAVVGRQGLAGYDLSGAWALEGLYDGGDWEELYCQCGGSRARFVAWLRRTYLEDLDALNETWGRRHRDWAEVAPPAGYGRFPDVLDWFRFHRDRLAEHLRWCVEALREVDQASPVVAAGGPPGTERQADPVALAREVAAWGCRAGDLLPHEALDRAEGLAGGKPLWLVDVPAHDAESARRIRWSLACSSASAVVYQAWRPDRRQATTIRPGLARPNGRPSVRLAEAQWLSERLAGNPDLAAARPAPPEVAIVVVPESNAFWRASPDWNWMYETALQGASQAFAQRGARTAFARPDALAGCPLAYVPLAFALSAASAQALRRYVEAGGCLVAEACLGSFDERGIASRISPGQGLDEVFGARAVDAAEHVDEERAKPTFAGRGGSYPCHLRREPLEATTGKAKAAFADGAAAIVDHAFGDGTTRLIGTVPSLGHALGRDGRYARVILDSLAFARVRPRVVSSSPGVCVRLLQDEGVDFLCAFNPTQKPQQATVAVSRSVGTFRATTDLALGRTRRLVNNTRRLKLGPAEGILLRLEATRPRRRWRRERGR